MKPLVSVLIPSRKRPEGLTRAVRSVFERAADPERVEVLIRLDEDDSDSPPAIQALEKRHPVTTLVGPRGGGYRDMHVFFNALAERAQGEFLALFNDDAEMITQDWDRVLDHQPRRACVLRPRSASGEWPLNCFPIFTRDIREAMGHMSQSPHCDIWLDILHRRLDLERPVAIVIEHRKHSEHGDDAVEQDEVFGEVAGVVQETLRNFGSYENHRKLWADTEAVAAILPRRKRLKYLARKPLMLAALARRWYWDRGPFGLQLKRLMRGRGA